MAYDLPTSAVLESVEPLRPNQPAKGQCIIQLVARDRTASFGRAGNIQLVLGREAPDAPDAANFSKSLQDMSRRHPDGFGLITIIQESSTPSPEARGVILDGFRASWGKIRTVLFVVEARGFHAAAQRSIMGTVMLAVRLRSRIHTVSSIDQGLPWFLETLNEGKSVANQARWATAVKSFCDAEKAPNLPPVAFSPLTK